MIHEFEPIARAVVALSNLKIISFGPRPLNFLACNAPIKQLYNLGVEIEENSELDLFEAFHKHDGDERIPAVVAEMEAELGAGNKKPEVLAKLAQYELTLKDWVRDHKGYRKYVAIAGVLACIPDPVWLCAVLRQQPSDRPRHPGILRSRYLRLLKRVHRHRGERRCRDTA